MTQPTMWAKRIGHELYIFWRGIPIYKRWGHKNKTQPSVLFNKEWPNEEVIRELFPYQPFCTKHGFFHPQCPETL